MTKPTVVIALGGNALLRRGEPLEADIQRRNVLLASRQIAALTKDWNVVLVHGNGPQVGLLALQNSAYPQVAPYPLDVLGAESQGMIGYLLVQELKNCLPEQQVSALLTQVEVDPDDSAFGNPSKYIGPVYDQETALALSLDKGWTIKPDGKYFRRVVPSPKPLNIIETAAINALIAQGHLVVCAGGGGIPVLRQEGKLQGIEAVIDKDLSAAFLAEQINADALLILTDADAVYLDWGTQQQRALSKVTPNDLADITFDAGSMGPKVSAASHFVRSRHGIAGIGALQDATRILTGEQGTLITPTH
ncbi:Carbamate kinase 1 [Serratia proteamaculans]|jgi:carbamate kinase|uniref:carbamate kinase n=1 Tax=Serratia proteamaculans TaxID=28151 RepID=UPI002177A85A|nr:carbamate kinase [Serratia proteamaculans]CAI1757425.1 Carbamate kinase 1 [Serratia proteamaculans]CAI1777653.1 Carbamate kinase 1 [Serratia proteamaculans]CAI1781155.1 Carbamate kinase 1 [Serratia proteamaculans]